MIAAKLSLWKVYIGHNGTIERQARVLPPERINNNKCFFFWIVFLLIIIFSWDWCSTNALLSCQFSLHPLMPSSRFFLGRSWANHRCAKCALCRFVAFNSCLRGHAAPIGMWDSDDERMNDLIQGCHDPTIVWTRWFHRISSNEKHTCCYAMS